MEEIAVGDRTDFAVAEEADGGKGAEGFRDDLGIMVGRAEKIFAPSVAAEEERGDRLFHLRGEGREEGFEFFVRAGRIAQLVLQRLAGARMRADHHRAGGGIGPEDIAHQKITTGELLFVFVHREAGEKIAPGALFVRLGQRVESLLEHLVSGAGAEFEEEMFVGPGDRQRLADRTASLADHRFDPQAVEGDGEGVGGVADARTEDGDVFVAAWSAGQATENGSAGERAVPFAQPGVGVETERIGQRKPGLGRATGRLTPESVAVRRLNLGLREGHSADFRFGRMKEEQGETFRCFGFARRADETRTSATAEHGGVSVHRDHFLEFGEVGRVTGRKKS